MVKFKLKKEIGLFEAVLYGVGIILGAGIYALVGLGAGVAGNALWISFLIGAIIAAFTGFSYAELSSMYPKEAAEFVYTSHAFRSKWLPFAVQWIMLFAVIIAAGTVALGFAGYFSFMFGGSLLLTALFLIALMSLVNYIGIKESARYNDISTMIEAFGLVAIIALGAYFMKSNSISPSTSLFESPAGIGGIFAATTIVYFAFIGFENLVNISEEAKNAQKIIPKALLISLAISSLIYILVSISAVGVLGPEQLSKSNAPLAEVAERVVPNSSFALSLIALFATSNTVLILLIVASRLLYGLSSNNLLPPIFSAIGKRGTPFISVITIGALAGLSLLIGNINKLAHLVDLSIFAVYIFINLSLIILRYREPLAKRTFKSPLNIGNFPVLALLGILLNLGMFYFFDFRTFIYGILLFTAGIAAYFAFNLGKKSTS